MSRFTSRYEKIKTLAEKSPYEGERIAAKAALKRMESKTKPMDPYMKIHLAGHWGVRVQMPKIWISGIS